MQKVTYELIMGRNLCYNPIEIGMPTNYEALPSEFIKEYRHKVKGLLDIHRALVREEFMSEKESGLFGVWCARQVQHLMTDPRSIKALDVAEDYIHGKATSEELEVARKDAYAAYHASSTYKDAYAADAAIEAAYSAANAPAYSAHAADAAIEAASYAAYSAASYAAYSAALNKQIDKLLDFFLAKEAGIEYDWS